MRGVYKLNFSGTDKCYIGQAENIAKRCSEHVACLKRGTASKKMQEAYRLYGLPTIYEVLCEIPVGSMDDDENLAIELFDTVTSGFNTIRKEGGSFRGQSGLDHSGSKYSKRTILKIFSLLYSTTITYKEIGIRTNTNQYLVANIAAGSHRWLADEYPEQYSKLEQAKASRNACNTKNILSTSGRVPKLKSPQGLVHEVSNISQFCREQEDLSINIVSSRSNIAKVIKGTKKSHLRWTLAE